MPFLCTPDDCSNERSMAGAVDQRVLHLSVTGILDVVWGGSDEGAEAEVECDAPFLQQHKIASILLVISKLREFYILAAQKIR